MKAKKTSKRQVCIAVTAAALLSIGGIAGAYAYFSGHSNMVVNEFSLVAGEKDQDQGVVIVEPEWDRNLHDDPQYTTDLMPGAEKVKDPYVESKVDYPSWILVKVEVPYAFASVTDDKAMQKMELVNYDICSGWVQLGDEEITVEPVDHRDGNYTIGKITRYYYYDSALESKHRTSSPVFTKFTIPDFTKVPANYRTSIDVTAYSIQTEGRVNALEAAQEIKNGLSGR